MATIKFNEVQFSRSETTQPDGTVLVTFTRVSVVRSAKLTRAEADILNAGKLTHAGNILFSYLIADGEEDPGPITLETKKAAGSVLTAKQINNIVHGGQQ